MGGTCAILGIPREISPWETGKGTAYQPFSLLPGDCARRRDAVRQIHRVIEQREHVRFRRHVHHEGFGNPGDRIIITAGVPLGTPGATNMLRIAYIDADGQGGI